MEDIPFTILELTPNKMLQKRGEFYRYFYYLVSGEVTVTISQNTIRITDSMYLGDYEILENVDYRLSLIRSVTRCVLKVYEVRYYFRLNLFHRQFDKAFGKFNLNSRLMKYWMKKLFVLKHCKRGGGIGSVESVGVIIEGSFKIDRNIPIVRMKAKHLQLLKRFQICLMSAGQIFRGCLVCQSNSGIVGVCELKYQQQLSTCFDEFEKIIEMASFKEEVHNSLEKEIAQNCRKKSKLFERMVPLPLKSYVKTQDHQERVKKDNAQKSFRSPRGEEDMFQLQNNISQFLHKQWRKGLSLSMKRKQVSPPPLKLKKSPRKKLDRSKFTVDIQNPIFVTYEMFKGGKNLNNIKMSGRLMNHHLPNLQSLRLKTEGNEKGSYRKPLYFQ